ncbi:Superoxide dismutase [Cu-Zn] [Tulasnella sp. 427]|nr:Superoxide dismutase [Cu-Zn] [Tulasnella sp. 427]
MAKDDRQRPSIPLATVIAIGVFLLLSFGFISKQQNTNGGISTPSDDPSTAKPLKASVVLAGDSGVKGKLELVQDGHWNPVHITGKITGLTPNALRGFHIHALGDLSDGCTSTGSHFNPFGKTHGAPDDKERHLGDLGNIQSDNHGVADVDISDDVISLYGVYSIIGRSFVVHTGTDDLGRGGHDDSKTTGHAGGRAACGVIGLAQEDA